VIAQIQSALAPSSPPAQSIDTLWWLSFWISAVIFALVTITLLYGAFRRRGATDHAPMVNLGPERRTATVVAIAVAVTLLILIVWLVFSVSTGRALTRIPTERPLTIQVIGHQWWWEVNYPDTSLPNQHVTTANEIHVPVGRTVLLELTASDVIHSFWAPNLNGKRDLIPGHITTTWFRADTAGVYRGQCAEFCGYQHAKMAFLVIAEPEEQFAAWLKRQRSLAATPTDSITMRGQQLFLELPCALCHSIQGTPANGQTGPDLTHLASRRTIAAGALANTRGNLAGWVLDPQRIKPGNYMPGSLMSSSDLQALLDYLQSLK
jgi:cytochrome c oxidase subunit 2